MLVRRSAHFVAKALLDSRTYAGTEAEADQSAPRSRISLAMCSRAFAAGDLAVLACYGEPAQADCSILPARLRAGSKRPFTRACISNWQSDR